MIYRKIFNNKGFQSVEIVVSLALLSLFIPAIIVLQDGTEDMIDRAYNRSLLLKAFASTTVDFFAIHYGTSSRQTISIPNQAISLTLNIDKRKFGNLFDEYVYRLEGLGERAMFSEIRIRSPSDIVSGVPVCSVDYINNYLIGSRKYYEGMNNQTIRPVVKQINLPISSNLIPTAFVISGDMLYTTFDTAEALDPDIIIFDISDSNNPIVLSYLHTGPGLSDLVKYGDYVFGSAASSAYQLHIIDVSSPDNPFLAKRYKLPMPRANSSAPFATSIFLNDKNLYVGTYKWEGQELNVIDIGNPINPNFRYGFETGGKISQIYLLDKSLHLASSDTYQYRMIKTEDGLPTALVSELAPSGYERQEGKVVSVFEDRYYFGRTNGGFNIVDDKEFFEIFGSRELDVPSGVYGIMADRYHVYVLSRERGQELSIFERRNFTLKTSVDISDSVSTMSCSNSSIYLLSATRPTLYEMSFQ